MTSKDRPGDEASRTSDACSDTNDPTGIERELNPCTAAAAGPLPDAAGQAGRPTQNNPKGLTEQDLEKQRFADVAKFYRRKLGPNPPKNQRHERRKRMIEELAENMLLKHSEMGVDEAIAKAEELIDGVDIFDPAYERARTRLAPSCLAPNRRGRWGVVEMAAVMRLPVVRWLFELLMRQVGVRARHGRPGDRSMAVASMFWSAFAMGRPDFTEARTNVLHFHRGLRYAFYYPTPVSDVDDPAKGRSAFYDGIAQLCSNDVELAWHVTIDLLKQIMGRVDNKGRPLHPNLCVRLACDATDVEADTTQVPYSRRLKARKEARLAERGMSRAAFRATKKRGQKGPDGKPLRVTDQDHGPRWKPALVGYKWVQLVCMDSLLPVIGMLIPAREDEREAAKVLITMLFRIWPECPAQFFVGDGAYDAGEFVAWLQGCAYLEPIVSPGEPIATRRRLTRQPSCEHGYMKLDVKNRLLARHRCERMAGGETFPLPVTVTEKGDAVYGDLPKVRHCWKCPEGICPVRETDPSDAPLHDPSNPRFGTDIKTWERHAMQTFRVTVESHFALLKHRGLANKAPNRAHKAPDERVEWLLALGCLYLVGRRLVALNGEYERTFANMKLLGIMTADTEDGPAAGDELAWRRVRRDKYHPTVQRPETLGGGGVETLPGYSLRTRLHPHDDVSDAA